MTTEEFTNMLKAHNNIGQFLEDNANVFDENAFSNYLNTLLDGHPMNITQLAIECGINVGYTHDLFKNKKTNPTKEKVLRIAFGLQLTLEETNRLLYLARRSTLRAKVRRDSILIFCFEHKKSIDDANGLLLAYGEDSIG